VTTFASRLAPTPTRGNGALARKLALCTVLALVTAGTCAAATVAAPSASLPTIQRQVMCVTCKIPLNVAQSPQADRERAFIQSLIDRGEDEAAIKHALVAQYGPTVLALPSDKGFDAAVYLVPLAACLVLLGALIVLLPRWRRRALAQGDRAAPAAALSTSDAQRLDADLERFD
jgi:cytochrome c-type biogenesis protein CcmH